MEPRDARTPGQHLGRPSSDVAESRRSSGSVFAHVRRRHEEQLRLTNEATQKLSPQQAYEAAYRFVADYYDYERLVPILHLLEAMSLTDDELPSSMDAWAVWQAAVDSALAGAPLPQLAPARVEARDGVAKVDDSTNPTTARDEGGVRRDARLTEREAEIVRRLVSGDRVRAIADAMFVSPSTVRNHLWSVYRKLGVNSQQQLVNHFRGVGSHPEQSDNR